MTAIFFAIDRLPPYRREFSLEDKTIMFPFAEHEHVPVWLLLVRWARKLDVSKGIQCWLGLCVLYLQVLCFIVPLVCISAYSLIVRKSVRDFHNGILGRVNDLGYQINLHHCDFNISIASDPGEFRIVPWTLNDDHDDGYCKNYSWTPTTRHVRSLSASRRKRWSSFGIKQLYHMHHRSQRLLNEGRFQKLPQRALIL